MTWSSSESGSGASPSPSISRRSPRSPGSSAAAETGRTFSCGNSTRSRWQRLRNLSRKHSDISIFLISTWLLPGVVIITTLIVSNPSPSQIGFVSLALLPISTFAFLGGLFIGERRRFDSTRRSIERLSGLQGCLEESRTRLSRREAGDSSSTKQSGRAGAELSLRKKVPKENGS